MPWSRVFNNYMVWRIVYKYATDLSWEYREAGYRYRAALYGDYEWPPTWRTCLDTVRYRLGSLLAIEFIKAHLGTDTKTQARCMSNVPLTSGSTVKSFNAGNGRNTF